MPEGVLADLEAGWRLPGDQVPWAVSERCLRALLHAQSVRPTVPLKPWVAAMARRDIAKGTWTAERPGWVNPSRKAPVWWIGELYGGMPDAEPIAMPCVPIGGEVVPTGPVLKPRRRGKLA